MRRICDADGVGLLVVEVSMVRRARKKRAGRTKSTLSSLAPLPSWSHPGGSATPSVRSAVCSLPLPGLGWVSSTASNFETVIVFISIARTNAADGEV